MAEDTATTTEPQPTQQGADTTKAANAETGFPAGTPLEQMSSDQREAYWKHQARKHEDRNKAYGSLTPEQVTELRAKAKRADELDLELGTTADKAAAKAADEAKTETRNQYQPALIQARLDAAAARAGVSEEDLAKAVEFADITKFLTDDGQVDTDRVKAFVATITPAATQQQTRTGPTASGQGNRSGNSRSAPATGAVSAGRDLYEQLHAKK
jgi:hypothetical protein